VINQVRPGISVGWSDSIAIQSASSEGGCGMRESRVLVRLSGRERKLFESIASKEALPIATWARQILLRAAKSEDTRKDAPPKEDLPLLSLFCGPGGLDEGFRQAGFFTQLAFDNDADCVNTFNANHMNGSPVAHQEDVCALTVTRLDELAQKGFCPVGVVGGPPCQSFSVSNVHQKDDDPRHNLPLAYARLLKALNNRSALSFFVFENVPGLLGKKHKHRYDSFKRSFGDAGFDLHEGLLDAQHFGVPQERERIFIVGINKKKHPTAKFSWPLREDSRLTVRDRIENLPEPVLNEPGLDPTNFRVHPNHWCMVPRSRKFETVGALKEGQAWGRSFRTLAWDQPSWTVAYGNREVHVHPRGHRRLSIYEAMLLQSFPQSYVLKGNISAQTRLVSEAVPPRLAWHIAVSLRRALGL
jgi:DNA (cytosine-5)-methyltransferase 1